MAWCLITRSSLQRAGAALLVVIAAAAGFAYTAWQPTWWRLGPIAAATANEDAAKASPRKILYYRNPMGLPDTSPVPKKDSMGMDYIAVYEGEDEDGRTVKISPGRIQRTGVRTETVERRKLSASLRVPGTIQSDERRIAVVSLRAQGFVESVEAVTTGEHVHKDQPLMRLYSPEIAAAAAQYLSALADRSASGPQGLDGAKRRLLNLDIPPDVLAEIERTRKVPMAITWRAPRDGIVVERNVSDGMRAMPGDVLFRIEDHSVVWALADVAERDMALLAVGQSVKVRPRGSPEREFPGTVALIYPHLNKETRSARVRIELANAENALRPEMYVDVEIASGSDVAVIAVPSSAVIDSGTRQAVILDKGDGRFEPREVKLGRRGEGYVEIRDGVEQGETVVVSANFLIDAESNLKAALRGLSQAEAPR
jgi:Cu(I)/Ag(I) efflux system membrane fusion protein